MDPLLGGRLPLVVVVLVLALLKANGEESASIEPGIRAYQDVKVVGTQKNGQLLLNCSAVATTPSFGQLNYMWYKDGKLIDFEEVSSKMRLYSNGSLYIKKVRKRKRKTDEGVYTCVVQNRVGSVVANQIRVQVAHVAKTFLREPHSQEAYVGGTARFECAINAFPAAVYVWQKDDEALPQDENKYTLLPSGVLHINNLDLVDTGDYRCITSYGELHTLPDVVDSIHWRKSNEAALTVKPAEAKRKPRIISGNQNITVKVGETVTLECLVDGSPLPNVTWAREDGKPIAFKYKSYTGHKNLKIRSVGIEDTGVYMCTARSRGYDVVKITSVLTVLVPPVITKPPQSQRWPRARTVILHCEVEAVPEAWIHWYHDGQEIERGQPNMEFKDDSLVIYSSETEHKGYYQCIAENKVGRASALARVEIWEPPNSPAPPTGLKGHALSSNKIFIQWNKSVTPSDLPIITYVVNVLPLDSGDSGPLTDFVSSGEMTPNKSIGGLKPYTNYSVHVKAFNKRGASPKSEMITILTMESIPVAAPEITLSTPSPGMIHVDWKEMLPPQSAGVITQYRVYYKMQHGAEHLDHVDGSKLHYTIREVEPERTYSVRVLARTKKGFPTLTDDQWPWVTIQTPKLISTFPTPRLNLQRINSSAVVVNWTTIDVEDKVLRYNIILRNLQDRNQGSNVVQSLSIEHPVTQHTFHGLENGTLYEVTVLAVGADDSSGPVAMEFRTTNYFERAKSLQTKTIDSNTILLTWRQPGHPHDIKSYDICFKIEMSLNKTCITSPTTSAEIGGLKANTRYSFSVHTHFVNNVVVVSLPLVTETHEDQLPSAPTNISYIVVSPGTVELHWKPPVSPNGVITSYVIFYNNNKKVPDTMWRNLTQTGGLTQATVQELTAASYFFKLRACTRAGQGRLSQIVVVYPKCESSKQQVHCPPTPTPGTIQVTPGGKQLGIIVGVTIGIVCIVICIIVIVFRNRCIRAREVQYDPPQSFLGNGHIPGHGNGHAVHVTTSNRMSSVPSADLDAMTPMLTSLPENAESDSKGGGTLIVTPNGVRVNGLRQSFQNGHVPNGHAVRLEGSAHLNDSGSSEEHRGLIAAMLASTDCSTGMEGSEMSAITGASLEEIDGSLEEESNTSLPVTAASAAAAAANREAAMLKVTGDAEGSQDSEEHHHASRGAQAAAAGSPSLRNNGGGDSSITADSSTSSHLPRSKTASRQDKGHGHLDRPPTPPPPLKSSIPSSCVCSSQESPVAPGTHVDSLPPVAGVGQLPHMYVCDGTWVGREQPDSVV